MDGCVCVGVSWVYFLLKNEGYTIPASAYRRVWEETDISSLETIYKYKTQIYGIVYFHAGNAGVTVEIRSC